MVSREKDLEDIACRVRVCQKCGLWKSRKNAVPGEGSVDAKVMFVGEAPGYSEDLQGRSFVGMAGKFLDQLLLGIGYARKEVFITNVVKCRPPNNRDPTPHEIATCTPYLEEQFMVIQPETVVALGNHSATYFLSKAGLDFEGISHVHGKVFEATFDGKRINILPMYHPTAAWAVQFDCLCVGRYCTVAA